MKTGDVLFVHGVSTLADAIEIGQDWENSDLGKWTHAGIFLIINNKEYVCEADKYGICLTPFSNYTDAKKELLIGTYKDQDTRLFEEEIISFCLPYCGHTTYFRWGIVQQAWRFLKIKANKILGKKILPDISPTNKDHKFMCADFVSFVYYNIFGIDKFKNHTKIAPVDILESDLFRCELYKYV